MIKAYSGEVVVKRIDPKNLSVSRAEGEKFQVEEKEKEKKKKLNFILIIHLT